MVFWVVWESNATGTSKLFGASSDIILTSEGDPRPLPRATTLNQSFPNPFNTETQISYVISERSSVDLVVCDALGRQVAQLEHEVKPPGSYRVAWDASRVASGVYFYTLKIGVFIQTRRMILLK